MVSIFIPMSTEIEEKTVQEASKKRLKFDFALLIVSLFVVVTLVSSMGLAWIPYFGIIDILACAFLFASTVCVIVGLSLKHLLD